MRQYAFAVGSLAILVAPVVASADVTITNCAVDAACTKIASRTVIKAPNDRVVVAAPIVPRADTSAVLIEAGAIEIAPGAGITADGKGKAIELVADTTVEIRGPLRATNTNGHVVVEAGGMVAILGPAGAPPPPQVLRAGDLVDVGCRGPGCTVSIRGATVNARRIFVTAVGDVQLCDNLFETASPRDLIKLTSHEGSIVQSPTARGRSAGRSAATAGRVIDPLEELAGLCMASCAVTGCGDGVLGGDETCDDASLTTSGGPVFRPGAPPGRTCRSPDHVPAGDRCTFCGDGIVQSGESCDDGNAVDADACSNACAARVCENEFRGGVESAMFAAAGKDIDVAGVRLVIEIAENIELTAGGTINLTHAVVTNLSGKPGEIEIEAAGGTGTVVIEGATIRDDEKNGQPPDVAEINGREQVPHTGHNNVVGTPAVDD